MASTALELRFIMALERIAAALEASAPEKLKIDTFLGLPLNDPEVREAFINQQVYETPPPEKLLKRAAPEELPAKFF